MVKINLSLSLFNSCKALNSSFVILEGDFVPFYAFLKTFLTSSLSSCAGPCSSLWHVFSIAVIYSSAGGRLGFKTNFGPWAKSFSCSSVNGRSDRFITHFFVSSDVSSGVPCWFGPALEWVSCSVCLLKGLYGAVQSPLFEGPPNFCCCKTSYFAFCLSSTLRCLLSMIFFH